MAVVNPEELARRDRAVARVRAAGKEYSPRFADWLLTHWHIWLPFEAAANRVHAKGFREYSPYVIVNVLRWQADVRGITFSMTNTLIPDLARLYNAERGPLFKTSTRFGKETT